MKIRIEIDDKYIKRNLYVFAGLEPVARRRKAGWEVKVADCSRCGKCCEAIRQDHPLGTKTGCRHLQRSPGEQMCGLNIFRPYGCAIADGNTSMGVETCTVRWQVVK